MLTVATTLKHPPQLPLAPIIDDILGTTYDVTIVFIGPTKARSLNIAHRGKDYVPNVLSFPLSDQCGEIYICPDAARKEAANFALSENGYLTYLIIHGALHLKGYDHGAAMEAREAHYCTTYNVR